MVILGNNKRFLAILRPNLIATCSKRGRHSGISARRVRSQESHNEQLKAELQRLKAEEEQLRFDIFKARLTAADQERLEQESKAQIDRRSPVSAELQLEVAQDEILREWFAADSEPAAE